MVDAKIARPAAGSGKTRAAGFADWLGLAAAPCFAAMVLVTETAAAERPDILCLSPHVAAPLSGMGLMYALMAAFHLSPWLRLIGGRGSG